MRPVILMIALASFCVVALSSNFNHLKQNAGALLITAAETVSDSTEVEVQTLSEIQQNYNVASYMDKPIASADVLTKLNKTVDLQEVQPIVVNHKTSDFSELLPKAIENSAPQVKVDGAEVLQASTKLDQQLENIDQLLRATNR